MRVRFLINNINNFAAEKYLMFRESLFIIYLPYPFEQLVDEFLTTTDG
jgi:hypothetical protein